MNSEVQSQRRGKNVLLLTQLNPVNVINLISVSPDPVGLNLSVRVLVEKEQVRTVRMSGRTLSLQTFSY